MHSKDVVPRIDNLVDTKELKGLLWSTRTKIELWAFLLKTKRSLPTSTISHNRYVICSFNLNATPVKPTWIIRTLSVCYICKFKQLFAQAVVNSITIQCLHFVLCYAYWDWKICKLILWLPTSWIACLMHSECNCTSYFRTPLSWIQQHYSSWKFF